MRLISTKWKTLHVSCATRSTKDKPILHLLLLHSPSLLQQIRVSRPEKDLLVHVRKKRTNIRVKTWQSSRRRRRYGAPRVLNDGGAGDAHARLKIHGSPSTATRSGRPIDPREKERHGSIAVSQGPNLRPDIPGLRLVRLRLRAAVESAGRRAGGGDGLPGPLRQRHYRGEEDQGHTRGVRRRRRGELRLPVSRRCVIDFAICLSVNVAVIRLSPGGALPLVDSSINSRGCFFGLLIALSAPLSLFQPLVFLPSLAAHGIVFL